MITLAQLVDDVVVNKFAIDKPSISIGRHPDNALQINDSAISGHHAIITVEANKYLDGAIEIFLEDLGSKNGTFVNGEPVTSKQQLNNNDTIRFGWNEFKLIDADEDSLESTTLILQ